MPASQIVGATLAGVNLYSALQAQEWQDAYSGFAAPIPGTGATGPGSAPAPYPTYSQYSGNERNASDFANNSQTGDSACKVGSGDTVNSEATDDDSEPMDDEEDGTTENPAPSIPDPFADGGPFDSFEDATGIMGGEAEGTECIGSTKNPEMNANGFTEKWIGQDPDTGDWYSALRNPATGQWAGGKPSSHME